MNPSIAASENRKQLKQILVHYQQPNSGSACGRLRIRYSHISFSGI